MNDLESNWKWAPCYLIFEIFSDMLSGVQSNLHVYLWCDYVNYADENMPYTSIFNFGQVISNSKIIKWKLVLTHVASWLKEHHIQWFQEENSLVGKGVTLECEGCRCKPHGAQSNLWSQLRYGTASGIRVQKW